MHAKTARLFSALSLIALGAVAGDAPKTGVASMDVLSGWRTANGTHIAALEIILEPGFKTYWRAPGGSGVPTIIDFSASKNLKDAKILWPMPEVLQLEGATTYGYSDRVTLPLEISAKNAKGPIALNAVVNMGVCSDICIPVQMDIKGYLSPKDAEPDARIGAALDRQPMDARAAGITNVSCDFKPNEDGFDITAKLDVPARFGAQPDVVLELDRTDVWMGEAQVQKAEDTLTATAPLFVYAEGAFALDRSAIRMTVLGKGLAADIQGCSADPS